MLGKEKDKILRKEILFFIIIRSNSNKLKRKILNAKFLCSETVKELPFVKSGNKRNKRIVLKYFLKEVVKTKI